MLCFKTFVMDSNLKSLSQASAQAQNRLARLRAERDEAGLRTAVAVRKWRQLESIMELEERRRDQTRILVELDSLLPRDNAWLLSLAHNRNGLTIEGISKDKEVVSQFLSRLEGAEYIERNSVNLVEIAQNMVINGVSLTRFKINARTIFPRPLVLDAGMPELGLPSREEMREKVKLAAPELAAALENAEVLKGRRTL